MRPIDADAFADWVDRTVPADTPELLISKSMVMAGLKTKSVTPTIEVAKDINVLDKWISVKDRLPGKNGDYLAYTCDGIVWPYFFTASSGVWEDALGYSTDTVTHWMPLPEAPKEET